MLSSGCGMLRCYYLCAVPAPARPQAARGCVPPLPDACGLPTLPSVHHLAALGKEADELVALAQAARTFLPVARHLSKDTENGPRPHVEPPVELLHGFEDILPAEIRILQGGVLNAALVDQGSVLQPSMGLGLSIQLGPRIRGGERDLDSIEIQLACILHGLPHRLTRLAGQAQDKRAVNLDAQPLAVLDELARSINADTLANVIENLLVAGLEPDQQQAQPALTHDLERLVGHVGLGVTRPGQAEGLELASDLLSARPVVGKRVVVEEELFDGGEQLL